jgi:sigma-E factor negative regulatory protein RseA
MYEEEVNQKISRLIDGELSYDETLDLLKKIQAQEALKTKMCRFQAISQALKTDEFYQVKADFSRKIFQEIQREPACLLPLLKRQSPYQPQTKQPKRIKMLAIAASTIAVAVLVGQSFRNDPSANHYQTITAMSVPPQQLLPSFSEPEKLKKNNRQPLNAQFNEYLQAHNSSVYTNGLANFQPYGTVTSYGQR